MISLAPGASHSIDVDPSLFFAPTGLLLSPGERYAFTASGRWKDGRCIVGPQGWKLWPFSHWNRVPDTPFFYLCGTVGEDDRQAFAIGEQFDWQVPASVADQPDRQLYLFANDWRSRYGNNEPLPPEQGGPLQVAITRLS